MSKSDKFDDLKGNKKKGLSRREFLEYSSAVVIGAALAKPSFGKSNDPHVKPETGMKYCRLGRTNLMISVIGLGHASGSLSRQLGPFLFDKWLMERGEVVNKLLDLGGNFTSTSTSYHNTVELLGKALKNRRDEVYYAIGTSGSGERMRAKFEKALKDLQTDVIDLVFSHGTGDEAAFETMHKLKDEGKIRFVGMSCHDPRLHEWAIKNDYLDWLHIPYNRLGMIKQGSADIPGVERVIKLAKEKDVGVIVIKPMTGNFIPYWAKQTSEPEIQEIMKKLRDYGPQNLYQAMIKWIIQNPDVTACAVGMDTVQQVIEDAEAVTSFEITAQQEELLELYAGVADKDYCRLCTTCVPHCPKGIPVPDILRFRMYYNNYGWGDYAKNLYKELPDYQKVTQCDDCGMCESHCQHQLKIMEKLQEAHSILAEEKTLFA